jgi:hypothetical protein
MGKKKLGELQKEQKKKGKLQSGNKGIMSSIEVPVVREFPDEGPVRVC